MSLRKGAEMERLTYRTELGVSIDKNEDCPTCSICWNCDIPPRKCKYISDVLKKLADYEDLEEQGLLLRLSCNVGDTVYCIEDKKIWDCIVDKVTISRTNGVWFEVKTPKSMPDISAIEYTENAFGKTVFLTKSEAEAKLKELRGGA